MKHLLNEVFFCVDYHLLQFRGNDYLARFVHLHHAIGVNDTHTKFVRQNAPTVGRSIAHKKPDRLTVV